MRKKIALLMLGGPLLMGGTTYTQKTNKKLKGSKPNIIMIVSDNTGYGDLSSYGAGPKAGINAPNMGKLDKEGMQFWAFYGQSRCTLGRAAMQTGRIPNRSGMTMVTF